MPLAEVMTGLGGGVGGEVVGAGGVTATDLGELMTAFNEVTAKLQVSHDQLTAEVARLRGQLREADDQLQRSRRLAALGEMAAGIAHEIRNPLGSIGLYASMLSEDLGDRPGEREVACKIGRAVRGLNSIVTDVLAFAGDTRVRFVATDLAEVVESAIDMAGVPESVRLDVRLPSGDACHARCDGVKLGQALVNVIRNGVEAIEEAIREGEPSPRPLGVTLSRVESEGNPAWAVAVRDSGTGLRGEVTERMFNPFFTTREAGTGLGLAIVHRIVDAHGGRVSVSNNGPRVGDGATVEILIPASGPEGGAVGRQSEILEAQG